jgi:hypothetical protein
LKRESEIVTKPKAGWLMDGAETQGDYYKGSDMNKTKTQEARHTPGAWYVSGNYVQSVKRDTDGYICEPEGLTKEEAQANAALIAAAPELLEALKLAEELLSGWMEEHGVNADKDANVEIIRQTISKAEGR